MESLFYSVNVKYLLITDGPIVKEIELLKASTEISGSKLAWLVALAAVLKKEESANTNNRLYIQAYNDYKKVTYQCGVNSGFYNIHYQLTK